MAWEKDDSMSAPFSRRAKTLRLTSHLTIDILGQFKILQSDPAIDKDGERNSMKDDAANQGNGSDGLRTRSCLGQRFAGVMHVGSHPE